MLRWSRALAFTVLVPGTVLVVLPYYLFDGSASLQQLQRGPQVIAGGAVLLVGVVVYGRCLWELCRRAGVFLHPLITPRNWS